MRDVVQLNYLHASRYSRKRWRATCKVACKLTCFNFEPHHWTIWRQDQCDHNNLDFPHWNFGDKTITICLTSQVPLVITFYGDSIDTSILIIFLLVSISGINLKWNSRPENWQLRVTRCQKGYHCEPFPLIYGTEFQVSLESHFGHEFLWGQQQYKHLSQKRKREITKFSGFFVSYFFFKKKTFG
jgi:hypothetical protein